MAAATTDGSCASPVELAVARLWEAAPKRRKAAVALLTKLMENIEKHPGDAKYKKLRLSNKRLESNLFSVDGGVAALLAVGFHETDVGDDEVVRMVRLSFALNGRMASFKQMVRCLPQTC